MVSPRPSTEASERPSSQSTLSETSGQIPAPQPKRGSTIGRYVILDRLGAGGMGVVYAGYDPDLDRKVAIKLLLPATDAATTPSARARMLREAQALAKLAHPNVVAIHDVGALDEQIWIAMEFVAGHTLTRWLEQPRRWTEVLEVMIAAGSGVAAAHAAGLLHRDLKPDNVMLGDDGRVRVMDFGLARANEPGSASDGDPIIVTDSVAVHVTRAGTLIGTPAYMAPELYDGRNASTASDQFALCVTVWETLFGQRPFPGDTAAQLAAALLERTPSTTARPVPAWLRRIVERGLAIDPAGRWPSIDALLAALAAGRARARRRGPIAATLGVAALVAAGLGGVQLVQRARRAACDRAGDELAAQWPGRREELEGAIASGGYAYGATTLARLEPRLDDHVARWGSARTELCVAATIDDELDAQQVQNADVCLTLGARQLQSLLDTLVSGEGGALRIAVLSTTELPAPERCADMGRLATTPWPAPEQVERVAELDTMLARATSLAADGKLLAATEIGDRVIEGARELGWAPLLARAKLRQGWKLAQMDRTADAETLLREAYFEAARASAWSDAADSCSALVRVVGSLGRIAEARTWADHGITMLTLAGIEEGLQRASLDRMLSSVERRAGAFAESERLARRSLTIIEAQVGSEHPMAAEALERIGNAVQERGDAEAALSYRRRALEIRERVLGPDHPDIASSLNNLAAGAHALGHDDEAAAMCERGIAILEASEWADSLDMAALLSTLSDAYRTEWRYAESERLLRRGLAIEQRVLGHDHPDVAGMMQNLAMSIDDQGRPDEAAELLEQSLAIAERKLPPGHQQIGFTLAVLGGVRHRQHRDAEAEPLYRRALELLRRADARPKAVAAVGIALAASQRALDRYDEAGRTIADVLADAGDVSPSIRAAGLRERAEIERASGRPGVALATLDEALGLGDLESSERGELGFTAARTLLAAGDRPAALERGHSALLELRDGNASPGTIAQLETWLAEEAR